MVTTHPPSTLDWCFIHLWLPRWHLQRLLEPSEVTPRTLLLSQLALEKQLWWPLLSVLRVPPTSLPQG